MNLNSIAKAALKPRPFLMVLSAPSGGGKTTVSDVVLKKLKWLKRCVTATTRKPRRGEKHGIDYWFLSEKEFKARIKAKGFYEWALVHGNLYGTPRKEVELAIKRGQSLLLVIDVQGGAAVKKKNPSAVLTFLMPPSFAVLQKRLKGRGNDPADVVEKRLREAHREVAASKHYDYIVLNDRLNYAVEHVEEVARGLRWRA